MKYEIEIDLPEYIAAKYVPVAVRKVRKGEHYIDDGLLALWSDGSESRGAYIILVPREWPSWCSADWLMKDADGSIWATTGERPEWNGDDGEWGYDIDGFRLRREVHADLYAAFEHVPPHLSLIENPKRTKSDSAV